MGFPKALLRYRGETFLDTLVGLFAARCSAVIVVLGAAAERIRENTRRPATFVLNAEWEQGMTTSLQCGLRAVPESCEGVLLTLVDHPAVAPATLDLLLAPPRPPLRVPRYGGKRGHPVWLSRGLFAEFLALPQGAAARDVVHSHFPEADFLDLDDPGTVADIDDPEAYRSLLNHEVQSRERELPSRDGRESPTDDGKGAVVRP
jgi:CTP:molybdopterin cytidylyltransferase MocA